MNSTDTATSESHNTFIKITKTPAHFNLTSTMITPEETSITHNLLQDAQIKETKDLMTDLTSSTVSLASSLASPVDSGVQLLDSESEMTSIMSTSGFDFTCNDKGMASINTSIILSECFDSETNFSEDNRISVVLNNDFNASKSTEELKNDFSPCKSPEIQKNNEDDFSVTQESQNEKILNLPINCEPSVENRIESERVINIMDESQEEMYQNNLNATIEKLVIETNSPTSPNPKINTFDTEKPILVENNDSALFVPCSIMTSSDIVNQNTTPPLCGSIDFPSKLQKECLESEKSTGSVQSEFLFCNYNKGQKEIKENNDSEDNESYWSKFEKMYGFLEYERNKRSINDPTDSNNETGLRKLQSCFDVLYENSTSNIIPEIMDEIELNIEKSSKEGSEKNKSKQYKDSKNDSKDIFNISLDSPTDSDKSYDTKTRYLQKSNSADVKYDNDLKSQTDFKNRKFHSLEESLGTKKENILLKPDTPLNQIEGSHVPDDQIVYRRHRRKKTKGQDTPKKRVSFHEDILNSTKIDDIHIDRGFVTRRPDLFYAPKNSGIVTGRYSWAAEGDSSYYQNDVPEREVKSEMFVNNFYGSNSSSSSISLESNTSSEESLKEGDLIISNGLKNINKVPKSSCLKKTKNGRKYIDTNVVQEELTGPGRRNLTRKKSESNILDTSIFGSLKNIYKTLSSSVPLAERGVPEGQEDQSAYLSSSSQELRRYSFSYSNETLASKTYEEALISPIGLEAEVEIVNPGNIYKKPNLRLSRSEGFYPSYPNNMSEVPQNIILCDSNVYEHKGISYSYEYDKFQSVFNQNKNKKSSSTVYQMLLKDLNFLKWYEQKKIVKEEIATKPELPKETKNSPIHTNSSPVKKQGDVKNIKNRSADEYSSDNETISDISEQKSRHLQSPLRKRNSKVNIQQSNLKSYESSETIEITSIDDAKSGSEVANEPKLKHTSSKSSLINRFLRNVTQKKFLDAKIKNSKKLVGQNKMFNLYIKGVKPNIKLNSELDKEINEEVEKGLKSLLKPKEEFLSTDDKLKRIFRSSDEVLYKVYKVRSAYDVNGESKPLILLLTNTTLYIAGLSNRNRFVLPYSEISFIIIGPGDQTVFLSNAESDMQFTVVTSNVSLTSDIVCNLEAVVRKNMKNKNCIAVKRINVDDMIQLRHSVYKQTPVTPDEDLYHYSIVHMQDDFLSPASTPLGPFKEGFLMYRKATTGDRWNLGYFILKGGVLYTLTSPAHRLPIGVTELRGEACKGVHRTPPRPRPHTFQVLTADANGSIEFAASDEYEASEWLQSIVQSASWSYEEDETSSANACTLLLSSDYMVTVRESFHDKSITPKVLSCAAIADLSLLRMSVAEHTWCVLEFSCREVNESSGDWVLFFSTSAELNRFVSILEKSWSFNNVQGDPFPKEKIAETEVMSQRYSNVFNSLEHAWQPFETFYVV